jgi:hypothetical protein
LEGFKAFLGVEGMLLCEVLETRESNHCGDVFSGWWPTTPKTNEVVVLGTGKLFVEMEEGTLCIGLKPKGKRKINWLNPESLYHVHDQTVNLYFETIK